MLRAWLFTGDGALLLERDVERKCQYCQGLFVVSARHPKQAVCHCRACRNAYKNQWRKNKLATDSDYRADKADAQKRWAQSHPDYWRQYRQGHLQYTENNRRRQRERNRGRKQAIVGQADIAKSDTVASQKLEISGYYRLEPVGGDEIAKSDSVIVKLSVISGILSALGPGGPDCKEATLWTGPSG